jgi:hypothetical protein
LLSFNPDLLIYKRISTTVLHCSNATSGWSDFLLVANLQVAKQDRMRHRRDLEISISPTDDFRASKLLRLLEYLGQSLDTLILRFQSNSNGNPTGLPTYYQLANIPSGMFFPSPSVQSGPEGVLLPKLSRLRVLSQGDASRSTAAGNLPSLLAHSSELAEIDLSGAPMDLSTFMTGVEHLALHRKSLEVLHLNLHKPRLASLGPTDPVDNHWIIIALDWLLDCCGILPHLRDLSISSFGGVGFMQGSQWVSLSVHVATSTLTYYRLDIMCLLDVLCAADQS